MQNKKQGSEPIQFNFRQKWNHEIRAIWKRPVVEAEVERIREAYREIAQFKYDEHCDFDEEFASAEYALDLHIAEVHCRDLNWLRSNFMAFDLVGLSLAIAQELYPMKVWEVLEQGDYCIVTDLDRTMVLDILNFAQLSAGASLALAGESKFLKQQSIVREIETFMQQNEKSLNHTLSLMNEHLGLSAEDMH